MEKIYKTMKHRRSEHRGRNHRCICRTCCRDHRDRERRTALRENQILLSKKLISGKDDAAGDAAEMAASPFRLFSRKGPVLQEMQKECGESTRPGTEKIKMEKFEDEKHRHRILGAVFSSCIWFC